MLTRHGSILALHQQNSPKYLARVPLKHPANVNELKHVKSAFAVGKPHHSHLVKTQSSRYGPLRNAAFSPCGFYGIDQPLCFDPATASSASASHERTVSFATAHFS